MSAFAVLPPQQDARQERFVSYCYRTSSACNKTTNAGGNHSDCLCLAILVKY